MSKIVKIDDMQTGHYFYYILIKNTVHLRVYLLGFGHVFYSIFAVFGHVFCCILPYLAVILTVFAVFDRYFDCFWLFLAILTSIWPVFAILTSIWPVFGHIGRYWAILAIIGLYCRVLAVYWPVPVPCTGHTHTRYPYPIPCTTPYPIPGYHTPPLAAARHTAAHAHTGLSVRRLFTRLLSVWTQRALLTFPWPYSESCAKVTLLEVHFIPIFVKVPFLTVFTSISVFLTVFTPF